MNKTVFSTFNARRNAGILGELCLEDVSDKEND